MAKKKIVKKTAAEKKAIKSLRSQAAKLGKKLVNKKSSGKGGSPIAYSKKASSSGGLYCYKLNKKK